MTQQEYNSLFNQALTVKSKIDTQKYNLEQLNQKREQELQNMNSLQENHTLYEESIEILKGLISKLSRHHIDHLEKLINTSVKTIFFDRKYTIEFEITEYRNTNNLQLTLLDETTGEPIRSSLDSNGYRTKSNNRFHITSLFHPLLQTSTYNVLRRSVLKSFTTIFTIS